MPKKSAGGPALGDRLRALRETHGWSLREVAAKAGVNHGYLSQLERGEVLQPAPAMLHKLSKGYGEPFVMLMRWAGYVETEESDLTANQTQALSYMGDELSVAEVSAIKAVLEAIRTRRATFAQHAASLDGAMTPDERNEIRALVLALLRRADSVGVVPTPLGRVMDVSQLVAAGEITLDLEERRRLRRRFGSLVDSVIGKLQGVIHFRAREVWIRPDLHELRKRFVHAHEIGHDVIPWQHDVLAYLDDKERLRPDVRIKYERQANQAAIELLAQGDTLRKEADDSQLTTRLLSDLSAKYEISIQATFRRIVEETRQEVALAIRFRGVRGRYGPYHVYCSQSFGSRFGWHLSVLPTEAMEAIRESHTGTGRAGLRIVDRRGSFSELEVETFNTQYALLALFVHAPRRRLTRRRLQVGQERVGLTTPALGD